MTSVACPACGAAGPPEARFCEACGLDLVTAAPPAGAPVQADGWFVVIRADRDQFDELSPEDMTFPADVAERVVALEAPELRIGRSNVARGIEPELDLSLPPADPAVSHAHALLVRQADGSYAVVDLGSANGTTVNDALEPIAARTPVPLADGDRVHVGAWTTITIRRSAARQPDRARAAPVG